MRASTGPRYLQETSSSSSLGKWEICLRRSTNSTRTSRRYPTPERCLLIHMAPGPKRTNCSYLASLPLPFQYQNVPKIAELNDKTKQIKKDLHSQIFKDFARCAPPTTCPAGPTSVFLVVTHAFLAYSPSFFGVQLEQARRGESADAGRCLLCD